MSVEGDTVDRPSAMVRISRRLVKTALHVYWRFRRGLTVGVRAAVIDDGNRVLLVRHTYIPGWYLPGGGVEASETVLDALARELREEACIEMTGAPRWHGVFLNRHVSNRDHVLVYVVRDFRVISRKVPDHEIAEAGFFRLDELPQQTTPGTRRRLAEIAGRQAVDGLW